MRDAIVGLAIVVLGVAYWHAAGALPRPLLRQAVGPEVFPQLIALALVVLGAILVLGPLLRRLAVKTTRAARSPGADAPEPAPDVRTIVLVLLGLGLYTIAFERLGFVVATILFMAYEVGVMEMGLKRWLRALPAIALLPVFLYVVFVKLLGVTLPPGRFG